ncbi:quinol monooxygenase YgiN [Dysgonomonas sp. PH5-45]|uniref:putative quinol monooxygenase n=1 Tax=unclassified Dysgonomonas TaxID=2630389 RepID=UPI0024758E33|nr:MULTISPECIES: putative quinol monooxygenase [unclassified Dysgonomonas]MDH6354793.1 quinol monooxygenase YgiN [Dysgonomonas sp. PH5-45]MDH6387692.1 quinol monooxygenase YgiN [Dysgonomonas sp. PH5-37]
MSVLKIVATITVKAEYKEDMIKVLHEVVDKTRQEEGNISYDLNVSVENPLRFVILEVWKSAEAIETHNQSAHFKAFVDAIKGRIESLDIETITPIY